MCMRYVSLSFSPRPFCMHLRLTCSWCMKIYPPTHIKPRSNPTRNGQHSMLLLPRYVNTGGTWPASLAAKSILNSSSKSSKRYGMSNLANGSSRLVSRMVSKQKEPDSLCWKHIGSRCREWLGIHRRMQCIDLSNWRAK